MTGNREGDITGERGLETLLTHLFGRIGCFGCWGSGTLLFAWASHGGGGNSVEKAIGWGAATAATGDLNS